MFCASSTDLGRVLVSEEESDEEFSLPETEDDEDINKGSK